METKVEFRSLGRKTRSLEASLDAYNKVDDSPLKGIQNIEASTLGRRRKRRGELEEEFPQVWRSFVVRGRSLELVGVGF